MFLGRETLEDHSQLPKKANKYSVGAVVSFPYVRRHRRVASSLHRESTDSLIHTMVLLYSYNYNILHALKVQRLFVSEADPPVRY